MCGRFYLDVIAETLEDYFQVMNSLSVIPRFNIAPSQSVPAVRQGSDGRELVELRWGLIPFWSKEANSKYSMINARAETVDEKPAYRTAFRKRRCLIPATGFFEWKAEEGGKQPFSIHMKDGGLFAFAGLWERWEGSEGTIESCSIIITEANKLIKPIHDRMPVIIEPSSFDIWLDQDIHDPELLKPLLRSYEAGLMNTYPVSKKVNNPLNDDPDCIKMI